MHAPRAIGALAAIAILMAAVTTSGTAVAQTVAGPATGSETETTTPETDTVPNGRMPSTTAPAPESAAAARRSEAWSCVIGGTIAALGAWAYAELVVMAAVTGSAAPVLLPVLATAFVTGCGIGTIALPGIGSIITGSR